MKFAMRRLFVLGIVLVMTVMGCVTGFVTAGGTAEDLYVEELLSLKHTLRFNNEGKFKIVVFSDIQDGYPLKSDTLHYMNEILDAEEPDLVLLGGDNHSGNFSSESSLKQYMDAMTEPMESRKIPWAQVYGNHVTGGYGFTMQGPNKKRQQEMYEAYPYNVSKAGTVYGVGNYVLPVLRSDSEKIAFNVFMLDSHTYLINWKAGIEEKAVLPKAIYAGKDNVYDPIHFEQIKWYWDTSVMLEEYNGSLIPAMMLFHIPLYEFRYVTDNPKETGKVGNNWDRVGSSEINSGLFQACYERGDVKAIFSGHQHQNDGTGTYMDIILGYTPTIGSLAYYNEKNRGARVVEIDQDDAFHFTTRMVYCKDLS